MMTCFVRACRRYLTKQGRRGEATIRAGLANISFLVGQSLSQSVLSSFVLKNFSTRAS